jgi:hypothetical protein
VEEKNLQDWIGDIVRERPSHFSEGVQHDPVDALERSGFQLHKSYVEMLDQLPDEQKEALARIFRQIRQAETPEELRQIYAEWADQYEPSFGWEGSSEDGPRGWS